MKIVTYMGGGPDVVNMGEAGQFTKRKPVTVEDDAVANQLLAKTTLFFIEGPPPPPTIEEQLALIAAAATNQELDSIADGETRKTVNTAIDKRRAELTAAAGQEG